MRIIFHKLTGSIDTFTRNIIIVFIGTFAASFLNLLYQLLIAHKFSPDDFAAFNALLSIFVIISMPLAVLQTAVAKYSAEFKAGGQMKKVQILLSGFFKKALLLAALTFIVFYPISFYLIGRLKIYSGPSGHILSALLATSWIIPVLSGGVQGLELFYWSTSAALLSGGLKIISAFIFIVLGFNIAGALGALLTANLIGIAVLFLALKNFISFKAIEAGINYREILSYLFPIALSLFCFNLLVNMDMVLVRYFFAPGDSGLYSLAQMVGKIFLFLPGAISIVMLPHASGLKAKNMDTGPAIRKSLLYACALCIAALLVYNLFPAFILRVLTGKVFPECIVLGRLFGISMSFFILLNILITYFISLKDLRFIKYLTAFSLLQLLAIALFHRSLMQVQLILCLNSIILFLIHLALAYKRAV